MCTSSTTCVEPPPIHGTSHIHSIHRHSTPMNKAASNAPEYFTYFQSIYTIRHRRNLGESIMERELHEDEDALLRFSAM